MTNTRKKRIRTLAEGAGVSHAEAANLLSKSDLQVKWWEGDETRLFLVDRLHPVEPAQSIGSGFSRIDPWLSIYERQGTAFTISEDGDSILQIGRPAISAPPSGKDSRPKVIVPRYEICVGIQDETREGPFVVRDVDRERVRRQLLDHMQALFDAARIHIGYVKPPTLTRKGAAAYFREAFAGQTGTIYLFQKGAFFYGVLNHAGIKVEWGEEFVVRGSGRSYACAHVGLVLFNDRVKHAVLKEAA